MKAHFSWERFNLMPIIGILRNLPDTQLEVLANLYAGAGLSTLEVTMNSPGATQTISFLQEAFGSRLNIGAGTVCSKQDLQQALAAGASFIVTPILKKAVVQACVSQNIPVFPGAYTPTEIYKAWSYGASAVKLFPATKLGPEFIRDLRGPLPQIKLLPTGGIGLENMAGFLRAGAIGLGIGSDLFPRKWIETGDWEKLKSLFLTFTQTTQTTLNEIKTQMPRK